MTNKRPNCIFEGRERNCVFICAIKSIVVGEELLIDCNLNRIDTNVSSMGVVRILIYPNCKQLLLYFMIFIMFFTMLIHLESFSLFTQCVLFLLSTITLLLGFQ
jgi:hypothetical protein